MSIYMKCPRDYTLRTTLGHIIFFEANKATPVPESAYQEALAKNILPTEVPDGEKPNFDMAGGRVTGPLKDALVFEAIQALVKRNNSEDFTGGGMPKAIALTRESGVDVSAQETSKYWDRYKQITAENSEFPTHPNVELVRELNGSSTRKQMEQLAADLAIDIRPLKGKSLAQVKAFLLAAIVNNKQAPIADLDDGQDVQDYVKPPTLTED